MELLAALMGDGTFAVAVAGVASCQPELEAIGEGDLRAGSL